MQCLRMAIILIGLSLSSLVVAEETAYQQIVACSYLPEDTSLLEAAIDRASFSTVLVIGTHCLITHTIVVNRSVKIGGRFRETTFVPESPLETMLLIRSSQVQLFNLNFSNDAGRAKYAVQYIKPDDNLPDRIGDGFFLGFEEAIRIDNGNSIIIHNNVFQNNRVALHFANDGVNSEFSQNTVFGGSGLILDADKQGPEGVSIVGNKFLLGIPGYCLQIYAGLMIDFSFNVCDSVIDGDAVYIATNHPVAEIKLSFNWYGAGGKDTDRPNVGLRIVQKRFPIQNLRSTGDTFYGWRKSAVLLDGVLRASRSRVSLLDADFYYPGKPAYRSPNDVTLIHSDACSIDGTTFSGINSLNLDQRSSCVLNNSEDVLHVVGAGAKSLNFNKDGR